MAASAGRLWAAYILIGSTYVQVAGIRTRSFSANNTNIDVTTADSPGRWRELLPQAGIQSLDMDVAGAYQNTPDAKNILLAALNSTFVTLRLVTPGIQIDGTFQVDGYKSDGNFNQEATFSCKFMSSGQVTVTIS